MSKWRGFWRLALAASFVGLILLLLLATQLLWSRCLPLVADDEAEGAIQVAWLYGPNVVAQRVRASYNGLSAISLRLDRPPTDGTLSVTLTPADEGASGDAWGAQVSDGGGVYTLSFPPQTGSAGKEYLLTLQAPTVPESQRTALSVYPHDCIPGELWLNGVPTDGDMMLRLCYRPRSLAEKGRDITDQLWAHYTDLDTLLNRLSQYKPFYFKRPQWVGLLVLNLVVVSWLVVYLWGQTFPRSPWSLRHSLRLALWVDLLAALVFLGTGLWSGKFGPVTELCAQPILEVDTAPAGGALVYDFTFGAFSDPNTQGDSPKAWYVAPDWIAIGEDLRPVLKMHPPSAVSYEITIPEDGAWLHGAAAMHPDVWSPDKGDGVLFQIQVWTEAGEQTIFYREIDPKNLPEHRRWHDFKVDLSQYVGQQVTIKFLTYPMDSSDWDWAMWGMPVLISERD